MIASRLISRTIGTLVMIVAPCMLASCSEDPRSRLATNSDGPAHTHPAELLVCGTSAKRHDPSVLAERLKHDAGVVNIDSGREHVSAQFTIMNRGKERTRILAIKPSCSCVSHSVDRTEIGAGESATLRIELPVESPGYIEHGATCLLANGQIVRCIIGAIGEMTSRVSLVTKSFEATPGGQLSVTVVFLTSRPTSDLLRSTWLVPRVEGPVVRGASAGDWFDLEPDAHRHPGRPTRLTMELVVHLNEELGLPGIYGNTISVGEAQATLWVHVPPAVAQLK